MSKFKYVVKRSGAIVPFRKERIMNAIYRAAVAVGGRDKNKAEWLADEVIRVLEETFPDGYKPNIEEIQDVVEKVLIENGHAKVAKEYILYRDERNKSRRQDARVAAKTSDNIPWQKIWNVLDWAVSHNLHTVESLNVRIKNGEFPHIVHEAEAAYEDDLNMAAELIIDRVKELKMVFVSGPSSSGKTTTTTKLQQRLIKENLKFVALNVDHYFFDLELHPKDEFGDYDFETPQALDLELINEHLKLLSEGKEIKIPYYDFKEGKRYLNRTPMHLGEGEILLIDSLHGLYPPFSESIPDELKFKLYLEPLLQMKGIDGKYIQWTDIRMIRRMLRDSVHRAYNPQQTLEHWHYVRSSELRNIIPYSNTADFVINSAMPYEIALYRPKLLNEFKKWSEMFADDPLKVDAYTRSSRIYKVLDSVVPVEDDSPVPHDSVLREFIGGSSLKY